MSLDIKEALQSLGYKLSDRGKYWQTNAMFRDGDNRTALQIYKDTGVWKDHVQDTKFMKFEVLVQKTLGTNNQNILNKYLKDSDSESIETNFKSKNKIVMEEVFDKDILNKLLPHYKFYNDRGISDKTLRLFLGGFATYGQMNKRFVFPILNQHEQIHGFAGRDMLSSDSRPKWKHIGRKSNWIYPAFIGDRHSIIQDLKEVILVESIGDMLALHENGIENVLVTFGLDVSPSLICFLSGLGLDNVVLSFNNDLEKDSNRGLDACVKNFLKLLSHFDVHSLSIALPLAGDFGDMKDSDFSKWQDKRKSIDLGEQRKAIVSMARASLKKGKLSKNLMKNIKYINE